MHRCLHHFMGVVMNRLVSCQHWPSFALSKGGGGALARECVSLYPNSMVTIYDLPKVVQVAKEQFVPHEEHRISFHEGRCGQQCSVVTAVAPELFVSAQRYHTGDSGLQLPLMPDCSLVSPGIWFIATTGLSQLCICSYLLLETQFSHSATQKLFTPEQSYLISPEEGYFNNNNNKVLQSWKNCRARLQIFLTLSFLLWRPPGRCAGCQACSEEGGFLLIHFQVLRYFRLWMWEN